MKIYTKFGDAGETSLFGGKKVSKAHLRICSYGSLDELNASLGKCVAVAHGLRLASQSRDEKNSQFGKKLEDFGTWLEVIQSELFVLGAELATPEGQKLPIDPLEEPQVEALEHQIDGMESHLPPLKTFIIPGGTMLAAELHLARTVARRAERAMVELHLVEPQRSIAIKYINRLSDALFVAARFACFLENTEDRPWVSPRISKKTAESATRE